jgi:hypothetical protein
MKQEAIFPFLLPYDNSCVALDSSIDCRAVNGKVDQQYNRSDHQQQRDHAHPKPKSKRYDPAHDQKPENHFQHSCAPTWPNCCRDALTMMAFQQDKS